MPPKDKSSDKGTKLETTATVETVEPVVDGSGAPPEAATVPPPAEVDDGKKTAEAWALAKEMLPAMSAGGALGVDAQPGMVEARVSLARSSLVAPRPNPRYRLFYAAKVMNHWPEGLRMTEADFDKAVEAADTGVSLR
jgi:hypothetical protein